MGGSIGKFSKSHILHFHKPDENRIYLFDTHYERLFSYPIYKEFKPFFFGGMETINIPKRQCIYIIGGLEVKEDAKFVYIKPKKPEEGLMGTKNTPRLKGKVTLLY
jgi:hypothetical protein